MIFRKRRLIEVVWLVIGLTGCATYGAYQLDKRYGSALPENRRPADFNSQLSRTQRSSSQPSSTQQWHAVQNILNNRCVVCHSCNDAPCQLKLTSPEAVNRGASKIRVYDLRLKTANPTRMYIDAQSTLAWRHRGFYPVLNERRQTRQANLRAGLLARSLLLKRADAGSDLVRLSSQSELECPSIEEYDFFAQRHSGAGMPYGFSPLTEQEHQVMMDWLAGSAPMPKSNMQPKPELQASVNEWERFFNGDSNKQRLMSRYIYEHLFASDLYFSDQGNVQFFRLVRSSTPPGQPVKIISSRRPYDDPGVSRPYYRLRPIVETIVAKIHRPYLLNQVRMARYRELFLAENYQVTRLPGYDFRVASNPFQSFSQIPVVSRYRFLLDDAAHFVDGFIKGPVCRGQVALNVIRDRFWVFFVNPDHELNQEDAQFLAREIPNLRLPVEKSEYEAFNPVNWLEYSRAQKKYQRAKMEFLNEQLPDTQDVNLSLIWNGDGWNKNAALTVYRHFDSASVVTGLRGEAPKTAWIISYSLFERIHYLLVAGFDVFGNVGHQLTTRLYMDFLRMDGESNFLALLPLRSREKERASWYPGEVGEISEYLSDENGHYLRESGIHFDSDHPKRELFEKLDRYLGASISERHSSQQTSDWITQLSRVRGLPIAYLPELSFIVVEGEKLQVYSLIHDVAHTTVSHLMDEHKSLDPQQDTLSIVAGITGSYPNAIFYLKPAQLSEFAQTVAVIQSEQAYNALLKQYALDTRAKNFWPVSDKLHAYYRKHDPVAWGMLDYSRLYDRRPFFLQ